MKKVVCMTSWPPRIKYVADCIKALCAMEPTAPDIIYLTLSTAEFPHKESDLPAELATLAREGKCTIVWVERNRKAFKKVFPVLEFLEDDDLIMTCDDDVIAPRDLLASRVADFKMYGGRFPISSNNQMSFYGARIINPTTVFTKAMLAHWDEWVDEEVYATQNDDRTYLWAMYLNGYIAKPCTKYSIDSDCISAIRLSRLALPRPMTAGGVHLIGRAYDDVVLPIIEGMTGKPIRKSLGYFKKI